MADHGVLLLPRLRVQNANAISGPLTWGFPPPSAFTGFAHALGRRLAGHYDLTLGGVGIICHHFEPQVFQPPGKYTQVFSLTRNPVDKDGDSAAFVEEGRAHLEISLLIQTHGYLYADERQAFAQAALNEVNAMRLAGGSVLPRHYSDKTADNPRFAPCWELLPNTLQEQQAWFAKLRYRLLPGFALVSRHDLLIQQLAELQQTQPHATALDALLSLSCLTVEPTPDPADADKAVWQVRRKPGWLVPIPVGYQAISPLYGPGVVTNARDDHTPFRFVESVYSLGEWVSPHRIDQFTSLLWRHQAEPESGLYRCVNDYSSVTA